MYGCECCYVKKAECWRIDAFELWCWRRLLRVPWTARRSNQFILKISPGCSLEGLILKLKLQYFGHLMQRVDSLEKTLMLGGIGAGEGDNRGWEGWVASPTRWTWVWVNSGSWWWTGRPGMLRFMGLQRIGHDWVTELNWTDFHESASQLKSIMIWKKKKKITGSYLHSSISYDSMWSGSILFEGRLENLKMHNVNPWVTTTKQVKKTRQANNSIWYQCGALRDT